MDKKDYNERLEEAISQRTAIEQNLNLRLRQQETIARLGEYALASQDLDTLFQETVRCVAETLEMEFCKILELLPDGQALLLRAGVGWREGLVGHTTVGTELHSQAGYTLLTDEPVIVQDLRVETRFTDTALLSEHQVISGMGVVIRGKDRPFGVLSVHSSEKRIFTNHDTRFIMAIASILATAIQRFAAEEALRRSRDELAIILQGVTEGVTVQDRAGQLVYANEAAAQLMGYASVDEVMTAPLQNVQQRFSLLDEQSNPYPYDQLPGRLAINGNHRVTAKIRFRINATGEEHWSIVDATPIKDQTGRVIQAVNIFRDITGLVSSEQYQRFLAEAGDLLASSLDYENTLKHVAQLAVTNLADWCSIYLVSEGQGAFQLTVAHKDPAKLELAKRYQTLYPPNLQGDSGVARVLKTGEIAEYPLIDEKLLEAAAVDAEHLTVIRSLGMRSALVVPLAVHDRILGAILLVWAESGRRYSQRDKELAQELARRAAIAMENARLYQAVQSVNAELEQRVITRTQALVQSNRKLEAEMDERRKTAAALQKSETMLNSLFESAPDATLLVDQSGKIVRVNQQVEALFGYSREAVIGSTIDRLIPDRLRGQHAAKREQYMDETVIRSMGAGLDLYGLRQDGVEFPVDIMLSPIRTEAGTMVICAVRDITERKRLQADLAETHRRLFESIEAERLRISQDLHDGPIQELYGVALYFETLRELIPDAEQLTEFQTTMTNIQAIIQSLRGICGELRPPTLSQFGLEKAIRSHLGKIRENHPELTIKAHLINDGLTLSDRTRLALFRVYQNAVNNVLRHSGASTIWVDFQFEDGQIRLEIRDDGHGFNVPNQWIHLARQGHFGLVGISERVEAIGGRLQVESGKGQGTVVRVLVPLDEPEVAAV